MSVIKERREEGIIVFVLHIVVAENVYSGVSKALLYRLVGY
jgi:hypothetical protein